jgi:hypothetical protein
MKKIKKILSSKKFPPFFKGGCPKDRWVLFSIIIFGFCLRIIGLNWDQGQHLHPDERFLTMVASTIFLTQKYW